VTCSVCPWVVRAQPCCGWRFVLLFWCCAETVVAYGLCLMDSVLFLCVWDYAGWEIIMFLCVSAYFAGLCCALLGPLCLQVFIVQGLRLRFVKEADKIGGFGLRWKERFCSCKCVCVADETDLGWIHGCVLDENFWLGIIWIWTKTKRRWKLNK